MDDNKVNLITCLICGSGAFVKRVAKEMLSTLLNQCSLTTDYWKESEAGSYILEVCAANKTEMLRCKEQAA